MKRAQLLLGCFRKGDAADPDTYVAAISVVLANYPDDIVAQVTDPMRGLASRSNFLPNVKEVRDACEAIATDRSRRMQEAIHVEKQLRERAEREAEQTRSRPTYAELQARCEAAGFPIGKRDPSYRPSLESKAKAAKEFRDKFDVPDDVWRMIPDAR